jgi:hypothetical protein
MVIEIPLLHSFKNVPSSSITRHLTGVIFLSIVSACAPVSPTASEDRESFERLCNAPDRDFIRRTVTDNGYAKARAHDTSISCTSATIIPIAFTEMGYQYFECVKGPWLDGDNPEITTYRFSLRKQPDPTCKSKNEEIVHANDWLKLWRKKHPGYEDSCIGATQQKLPSSRYIQLGDSGRVHLDGTHVPGDEPGWRSIPGYISFSRKRVLDRRTNEIIAEHKFYSLLPASAQYIDLAKDHCEVTDTWQITDVVKPISTNN